VRKIVNAIAFGADLAPGLIAIAAGVAVIVGASTGVLWY
jgi:hypothetical protein